MKERKEVKRDWDIFNQYNWYWESLNLIKEDRLKNVAFKALLWFLECFWSYNDREVVFFERERNESLYWVERNRWKEIKDIMKILVQYDLREAANLV